jgi:hypothetical protein
LGIKPAKMMQMKGSNKPKTPMHEFVSYFDNQLEMLEPFAKKDSSISPLIEITKKHRDKAVELMETEIVALRHSWNDLMFDSFLNYMRYFYQERK